MSAGNQSSCSSPVLDYLNELYTEYAALKDGQVATYIPELAKANPDWFGICLATTSGAVYEVGDSRDANISIEGFLGRKRSPEPFLKKIGIGKGVGDVSVGDKR